MVEYNIVMHSASLLFIGRLVSSALGEKKKQTNKKNKQAH